MRRAQSRRSDVQPSPLRGSRSQLDLLHAIRLATLTDKDHPRVVTLVRPFADLFDALVDLAETDLVTCSLLVARVHDLHSALEPQPKATVSGAELASPGESELAVVPSDVVDGPLSERLPNKQLQPAASALFSR